MGSRPVELGVDNRCESHEVKRLYVGDSSLIPRTLSVNPSLTIMALATRLAEHLHANASGYLGAALRSWLSWSSSAGRGSVASAGSLL